MADEKAGWSPYCRRGEFHMCEVMEAKCARCNRGQTKENSPRRRPTVRIEEPEVRIEESPVRVEPGPIRSEDPVVRKLNEEAREHWHDPEWRDKQAAAITADLPAEWDRGDPMPRPTAAIDDDGWEEPATTECNNGGRDSTDDVAMLERDDDEDEDVPVVEPPGRRHERTMAAQVLAKLVADGILSNQLAIRTAAKSIGLRMIEITYQLPIVADDRYVPPRRTLAVAMPDRKPPSLDKVTPNNRARYAKTHPTDTSRICSRCKVEKPIIDPDDGYRNFRVANRKTGTVQSMCTTCHLIYKKARYVKVGYKAVLVELTETDVAVGHHCTVCDKDFKAGELVVADRPVHFTCTTVEQFDEMLNALTTAEKEQADGT